MTEISNKTKQKKKLKWNVFAFEMEIIQLNFCLNVMVEKRKS